jgi:hypothetical protein
MVGDRVSVEGENGSRRYGVITDIKEANQPYNSYPRPTDEQHRSFSYIITLDDTEETVTRLKPSELQRDRKVYSKLILKQFLRSTVSRESWIGAPWMAKDHLAKRYSIPTKIPDYKTRDAVMAQKKATNGAQPNGGSPPNQYPYPPMGNGPQMNGHRPSPAYGQGPPGFVNYSPNSAQSHLPPHLIPHLQGPNRQYAELPPPGMVAGPQAGPAPGYTPQLPTGGLPPNLANILNHPTGPGLPVSLPFQNGFMQYQRFAPPNPQQAQPQPAAPVAKPFEPIRYPIEDLEIAQPRLSRFRPTLKFFSDDVPEGAEPPADDKKTGILMKSMGPLLTLWETLNVHDTVYDLDSFTFDDFVDAMRFSSDEVECELFVEVHCSILKQIVDYDGKLQAPLPHVADEESDEEDSEEESEPTPEPEPPARSTRSSLRKSEAQQIVAKARTPTPEPPKEMHRAAEFVAEYDWIEQCKIRNFINGGWQASFVALLYRLSFDPIQKEACDEILAELVPPDEDPTVETIAANYNLLDVNLRIKALDMALRLTVATEQFREQLISASQEMTRLRKEKIEYQRKRKEL